MDIDISPPRSSGGIEIKQGRPDVQARILEFVEGTNGGKTVVYVCGPAGMADAARMAVGRALKEGRGDVEFFEETFGC